MTSMAEASYENNKHLYHSWEVSNVNYVKLGSLALQTHHLIYILLFGGCCSYTPHCGIKGQVQQSQSTWLQKNTGASTQKKDMSASKRTSAPGSWCLPNSPYYQSHSLRVLPLSPLAFETGLWKAPLQRLSGLLPSNDQPGTDKCGAPFFKRFFCGICSGSVSGILLGQHVNGAC